MCSPIADGTILTSRIRRLRTRDSIVFLNGSKNKSPASSISPQTIILSALRKVMMLAIILNPFLMILAILENQQLIVNYLLFWDDLIISYVGILIYIIGGSIVLLSRIQLGKLGSGAISHLQEEHRLYTGGMYKYVRHPLYTGGLISAIGMNMAFRSIIMPVLIFILYFTIFKHRIEQEEQLLITEFGEEYLEYSKRTKRLFPLIY